MQRTIILITLITLLCGSFLPASARSVDLLGGPSTPGSGSLAASLPTSFACGYSSEVSQALSQTSTTTWLNSISRLSGATPVTVAGQSVTLASRHSPRLFNGQSKAFDYLKEQVLALYPASQIEEDPYDITYNSVPQTWKNLILTLPGSIHPDQVVILSAHFDSTASGTTDKPVAPGADDNASGSTTLLEAARILKGMRFDRTIRIIWFTGEEQGLFGSEAYVADHIPDPSKILGVINLDMYAYDGDNDRCFELHVGTLAPSNVVGQCIATAIAAYNLNLKYDYLTTQATQLSDHSRFWKKNIGAVEVGQNFFTTSTPGGCVGADENPNYHTTADTIDKFNQPPMLNFGFDLNRTALAALMGMAIPYHPHYIPLLMNNN